MDCSMPGLPIPHSLLEFAQVHVRVPLEEGMANHSSIHAWRIPWTEEPGGLESIGSQSRTRLNNCHTHVFFLLYHFLFYCINISYSSLPLDTNQFFCSYKVALLAQLTYIVRKWVCQIQAVHLSTRYMFAAARHKGKEKVDHLPTSSWRLSPRATIWALVCQSQKFISEPW